MKSIKLGDRDRQLLAVVAEARCLSTAQLRRLFFRGDSEKVAQRRLRALSSGERALLRVTRWADLEGLKSVWSLTPTGYIEVERFVEAEVEVPRDDIGAQYLDHHVQLVELYVGLLAARVDVVLARVKQSMKAKRQLGSVFASASHPAFRWNVVGDRDLPWKQPDGAKLEARVIRPDAILELPQLKRRVFVESETGSHSIVAVSASKTGATIGKVERYEAYCTLVSAPGARTTWYTDKYRDGFAPEVLFLVRSDVRRLSVEKALADWRRTHPRAVCRFKVATVDGALRELLPAIGHDAPAHEAAIDEPKTQPPVVAAPATGLVITKTELRGIYTYFAEVQRAVKEKRERARAEKAVLPEYPAGAKTIDEMLRRLKDALAS